MNSNNNEGENSPQYEKMMYNINIIKNIVYVIMFLGAGFTTYFNLVLGQQEARFLIENHIKIDNIREKQHEAQIALLNTRNEAMLVRVRDLEEFARFHEVSLERDTHQ